MLSSSNPDPMHKVVVILHMVEPANFQPTLTPTYERHSTSPLTGLRALKHHNTSPQISPSDMDPTRSGTDRVLHKQPSEYLTNPLPHGIHPRKRSLVVQTSKNLHTTPYPTPKRDTNPVLDGLYIHSQRASIHVDVP